MTDKDLVQRLYERLLVALAGEDDGASIVTVGDIYQRLIPYRSVRSEVGVMELATYEHALLRLLSGERGLVRIEVSATEELRRELDSPNPILGVYRDYADVPATLDAESSRDRESRQGENIAGGQDPMDPVAADAPMPSEPPGVPIADSTMSPIDVPGPALMESRVTAEAASSSADLRASRDTTVSEMAAVDPSPESPALDCQGCGKDLPDVEGLRFCPFCGWGRDRAPCGQCGTKVEFDWNFCIRCGASVSS